MVSCNSTSAPVHGLTTNLLKRKAKQEEMNVIKKHATLPRTSSPHPI
jgi:hypothetical protein